MIGGKQFTITWNVDVSNISHVNKELVDKMIEWMKGLYGQYMKISRGKKHDYLGMMLDLSVRGQFAVAIVDYPKGVISDFEEAEILTGTDASLTAEHLYTIREESDQKKLDEKRATEFCHNVTQLIFACQRKQKDIQTTVSFLTTRV